MPKSTTRIEMEDGSRSLWGLGWKRLKKDRIGLASLWIVGAFICLAVAGWAGLAGRHWRDEVAKPYAPPTLFRNLGPRHPQLTAENVEAANKAEEQAQATSVGSSTSLEGAEDPLAGEMAQAEKNEGQYRTETSEKAETLCMGADYQGRDVLQKTLKGTATSLLVGLLGAFSAILLGTLMGAFGGYFGGLVDDVLAWFYSVFTSVPDMLLLLAFSAVFRRGITTVIVIMALTSWTGTFRLMRAEFMKHRSREYVKAADALGASHLRRMFVHILPNVTYLLLVQFSILTVALIKYEVILSFLGFGVSVTQISWGSMLAEAPAELVQGYWWQMACVTLFMSILVTAFSMLNDSMRDALDPKVK